MDNVKGRREWRSWNLNFANKKAPPLVTILNYLHLFYILIILVHQNPTSFYRLAQFLLRPSSFFLKIYKEVLYEFLCPWSSYIPSYRSFQNYITARLRTTWHQQTMNYPFCITPVGYLATSMKYQDSQIDCQQGSFAGYAIRCETFKSSEVWRSGTRIVVSDDPSRHQELLTFWQRVTSQKIAIFRFITAITSVSP